MTIEAVVTELLGMINHVEQDPEIGMRAADVVVQAATALAPVGPGSNGFPPGRLRDSLEARTDGGPGGLAVLGAGSVNYAVPVHFGSSNRPQGGRNDRNEFLYQAAEQEQERVRDDYERSVNAYIAAYL